MQNQTKAKAKRNIAVHAAEVSPLGFDPLASSLGKIHPSLLNRDKIPFNLPMVGWARPHLYSSLLRRQAEGCEW